MKNNDKYLWGRMGRVTVSAVCLVGVWGCATGIQYSKLPSDADPSQELASLSQQMAQDRGNQVDVYAPESFTKAHEAFEEANRNRDQNKSADEILDAVAKSRAYLVQAEERSGYAQGALGEVVSARTRALQVGAPDYSSSREVFSDADDKVGDFAKSADRSSGPPSISDTDRTRILAKYKEAELHAVEQGSLARAQNLIKQARKEGAEKLAPQSLATAQGSYSKAQSTIRMNPENSSEIERVAGDAETSAQRLLEVTRLVKANQNKHPESVAAASLGERDALSQVQQQNSDLEKQRNEFQSAGQLTETVKQIQAKLSPDEAQVFEDGSRIHIRLKGIKFATGSSTLDPSEYPLMGKVGQILKDSQPQEVRIDGRTDSVGKKETNQRLSEKRAEAVKQFLVASVAVDGSKIKAEGFGSSKPIASEKTKEGRAMNRSIDVVMLPGAAESGEGEQQSGQIQEPGQSDQGEQSPGSQPQDVQSEESQPSEAAQ